MSELKVEVVAIDEILPHPNADRLELAKVKGWMCIVGKGSLKPGDKCVYIPIDSVLSPETEVKIFPIGSKVTLHHSRVKTIKLRGAISQGLVVQFSTLGLDPSLPIGTDLTEKLGITKYEPPAEPSKGYGNTRVAVSKKQVNPSFHKYTHIENFKNYPKLFEEGELVSITEKIHGTNFRCGYVPFYADTLFKKIKKFFRLVPEYEFVYGSRTVQLQNKMFYKGFYDTNVYAKIVKQYRLDEILKPGEVLYGEIYGDGIQKGYTYGCGTGEHKLVVFDLIRMGSYVDASDLTAFVQERGLPQVPVLYVGPYNEAVAKSYVDGDSVLAPTQKIREGIVIKPLQEVPQTHMGRKVLKLISDEYLLGDQTDFH